jgi:hypothetical protein
MKYDIAKNEEGPLRRTIKGEKASLIQGTKDLSHTQLGDSGAKTSTDNEDNFPAACHPGLDERLGNIETHLSVRYGVYGFFSFGLPTVNMLPAVPTIPRTLLTRLKFLEDHIVRIEKDYPPWAALHFNQPNRGVSEAVNIAHKLFSSHLNQSLSGRPLPAQRPSLSQHIFDQLKIILHLCQSRTAGILPSAPRVQFYHQKHSPRYLTAADRGILHQACIGQ